MTLPFLSTVATLVLLDSQVTSFTMASAGVISVTFSCRVLLTFTLALVLFRVMPVTFRYFTVILQVALAPPSADLQVMTAEPAFRAVTLPLASTFAMSGLSLDHFTFLLAASAGRMEATDSCTVGFGFSEVRVRVTLDSFRVISETRRFDTEILHVALAPPPSEALQVMIAVPYFRPVTRPVFASTVATSGLSLVHLTF